MKKLELLPIHDSRKSFYRKAFVLLYDNKVQLQSYETIVGEIINGEYTQLWDGKSQTTTRHIKEFKKQFMEV